MKKLISIELNHKLTGKSLKGTFYEPFSERRYFKEHRTWITSWKAGYRISRDGKIIKSGTVSGVSWLTALLLAIDGFRREIPAAEEEMWTDKSEVPSWLLLPTCVEVSWGYSLFRKLRDLCKKEEARYVSMIEKKRKRYESEKKRHQ